MPKSSFSTRPDSGSWTSPPVALLLLLVLAAVAAVLGAEPPAAEVPTEDLLREAVRLRGLALADMEEGDCSQALERLGRMAEILPDNVLPPVNQGICWTRLGRWEEASSALDRAAEMDPANPRVLVARAALLEQRPGVKADEELEAVLAELRREHPQDVRAWALLARVRVRDEQWEEAAGLLSRALAEEPENLVLLGDLLVARAELLDAEGVLDALNAIEDRLDGLDGNLADFAGQIREAVWGERLDSLRPMTRVVRNLLRPTELYQVHRVPLEGKITSGPGFFPQVDFVPPLPPSVQGGKDLEITFERAEVPSFWKRARLRGLGSWTPGVEALILQQIESEALTLWPVGEISSTESFLDTSASASSPVVLRAIDADGLPDLVSMDGESVELRPGQADGSLGEPVVLGRVEGLSALEVVDLEPDGDLDLLVGDESGGVHVLVNPGSGPWPMRELGGGAGAAEGLAEASAAWFLGQPEPSEPSEPAGPAVQEPRELGRVTGFLVVDLENDGDLDVLVLSRSGASRWFENRRNGTFLEQPGFASRGYENGEVADFDGDGRHDLVLWDDEGATMLRQSDVGFTAWLLPEELRGGWRAAAVADLDNDADLDLLVVPDGGEDLLFARNLPGQEWSVLDIGSTDVQGVDRLEVADVDGDGDLDPVLGLADGVVWLRNEGGNRNHWLRLALRGRSENNSKNNVEGLFSRIEASVGGRVQTLRSNGRVNHIGLGDHREVDVLRVVWSNGVPQTWQLLAADRTLVEEQVLKGSCPFVYSWDGEGFQFQTDLLWRSPLGMILADGRAAPHQSGRDWVLIPGENVAPVDGQVWLQITEELWEVAWIDRLQLLAVDHPVAAEIVVDESFRPPPYPTSAPLHWIENAQAPRQAVDHRGRDVLDLVTYRDGRRVDALPLTRYQGLTAGQHVDLVFDLPAVQERRRLLLTGWIFPTDTTINVALSQDPGLAPRGPRLLARAVGEVAWREVSPFIGFPNGKRKTVVVELDDDVPAGPVELRIETNLQIYWDQIRLAVGDPAPPSRFVALDPVTADLHERGFSREFRSSPTGPHLFAYVDVAVGPRYRDPTGAYTRFGRVDELLGASDDRSAVLRAGDEITVRFDVRDLPTLPDGWRRDWVLHTDGWVKDADLNTIHSDTVTPQPLHAMTSYPDSQAQPQDLEAHRRWLRDYQTRVVGEGESRLALPSSDGR